MNKILIVDDLKPFVDQQKGILSRADLHIFTASSGTEALSIHKNIKVDLMIVDLEMPGMKGDELCTIIRKDSELKFVSFLLVTRPRETDIARCKKCGANDYITKPITPAILIEKTSALLGVPMRKAYRVFVNVTVEGESSNNNFLATSINISTTGLLMEAKKELSIGNIVHCSFFLPDMPAISVTGEVVRILKSQTENAYQHGIKFTEISNSGKKIIEDFIKNHALLKQ